MSDVLVAGCGLIGTSVGLALRGSDWGDVTLTDASPDVLAQAVHRGAGRAWDGQESARLVVVAVPPAATASTLLELQSRDVGQTYTHVCSVQAHVQDEVERLSSDPSQVVGGHPLAGREVSGPQGAHGDLFVGRPWALCPGVGTAPRALADLQALATRCGAVPVVVGPQEHDARVALLSHLPQIVASALAGLLPRHPERLSGLPVPLSGPGLADTTRLAASSTDLWTQVLTANAGELAPLVAALSDDLDQLATSLARLGQSATEPIEESIEESIEVLERFLERGQAGRALVPVKHQETARAFAQVRVELPDEPGQLAALLVAIGGLGVNVEDLRLDHVPGRPRGVVELMVAHGAAEGLAQALQGLNWQVVSST